MAAASCEVGPATEEHVPVLVRPLVELLDVRPGERILDMTIGWGGHAARLAEAGGLDTVLVGVDSDPASLDHARRRLKGCPARTFMWQGNFADFDLALTAAGLESADVMVADLGLNLGQLADASRGFSFAQDGPLDMRIDPRAKLTAEELVNGLPESELAELIYRNSQEPLSRRIAKRIGAARRERRIRGTLELANIVAAAMGVDPSSRPGRTHPATRTFQALRMAVNDELAALETMLEKAPRFLSPGGRLAVISFHSLEDARVKRDFKRRQNEGIYRIRTKKPVTADAEERQANPRSRSAKLRVAERLGPPGAGSR